MRSWPGALAFVAAILPIAAHAQVAATAPQIDPGLILQQNRGNQRQLEEQNAPQIDGPSVVAPGRGPQITTPAGGPKVLLRSVVFDPSTFLTKEELDAIAARFVSRRVDISDIQKLVKEVNDLFAAKGVVTATAYLPPQKLDSGVLHVGIVEGKLETVTVKGTVALMPQFVIKEFGGEPGTVVDINQVSDRVALINKTGFAQVQAFLQPGSQFGLTDIQLAVTEPPVNAFDAFLDNQGVPAVGRLEEGLLFQHYGLFGIDDKLTFYGVRSDGDLAGNLAYSLPFDTSGGRVGVSYNRGTIRVVNGPFAPLHITGNSMIGAINASQPLFVSQNWLVLATAAGSFYESISKQQDITITHNDTIRETGGLTVGYTNGTVLDVPGGDLHAWPHAVRRHRRSSEFRAGQCDLHCLPFPAGRLFGGLRRGRPIFAGLGPSRRPIVPDRRCREHPGLQHGPARRPEGLLRRFPARAWAGVHHAGPECLRLLRYRRRLQHFAERPAPQRCRRRAVLGPQEADSRGIDGGLSTDGHPPADHSALSGLFPGHRQVLNCEGRASARAASVRHGDYKPGFSETVPSGGTIGRNAYRIP